MPAVRVACKRAVPDGCGDAGFDPATRTESSVPGVKFLFLRDCVHAPAVALLTPRTRKATTPD